MGGVTLGIKKVMQSKKLVMAVIVGDKAQIAEKMVSGPVTQQVPASILQLHPSCEVILDPQAAEMLAAE